MQRNARVPQGIAQTSRRLGPAACSDLFRFQCATLHFPRGASRQPCQYPALVRVAHRDRLCTQTRRANTGRRLFGRRHDRQLRSKRAVLARFRAGRVDEIPEDYSLTQSRRCDA